MQIAIVHYHLNRGGVTQVIVNHLRALAATAPEGERLRAVVFFGGRRAGWPAESIAQLKSVDVHLREVPALDYDGHCAMAPAELSRQLVQAMRVTGLTPDDCVVHIHNHALGKNAALPSVVAHLAADGFALLLQIHDFSEDFRPDDYRWLAESLARDDPGRLPERLYPQGAAVHYAVLNGRDFQILSRAGVPGRQLHSLPNPVSDFVGLPDRPTARSRLRTRWGVDAGERYVVYPVRGIRRKNLGELLLWAAAHPRATRFAITLPPINPREQPRYEAWKQLAGELQLPLLFEVGGAGGLDLGDHLAAADAAISTSVAEGFGMVFLETWLAGLPLIGRDLPEITADFTAAGLRWGDLAPALNVPLDWVGRREFSRTLRAAYESVLAAYGRQAPDEPAFARQVAPLCDQGLLDFARCGATLQAFVIAQVARDPARRAQLWECNPALRWSTAGQSADTEDRIRTNAEAVRKHYSLRSFGDRLRELYQLVLGSPRQAAPALENGSAIMDAFLSLPRFSPIRFE